MVEKPATSELMEAATAFDDELARFGRLVEAARTGPLNSQKHLQRAARAFEQLAESEQRLGVAAQTLVGALQTARQRQEAQAQAIQGRAREIEARTTVAAELLQRYGAVGQKAGELNALVLEIAAKKTNGSSEPDDAVVASLAKLRERMGEVADIAGGLVASAREADFEDIARQADSLRQQIASVGQKVAAIERALSTRSTTG
jgi:predicted nucleic acid-binding protein